MKDGATRIAKERARQIEKLDCEKAGALCAAEIDRLLRAQEKKK